ncbi:uncharacterized protein LOC117282521 [Cryptotermes secundus]|uniref:uncharacterized protein LOC117282521 n=1 Tax=Cryptotermes secundus TaxID=105785 RepID=UPI001454C551|nr:uncharacterized protein LOC117282521 [Cryptotermes secundus]
MGSSVGVSEVHAVPIFSTELSRMGEIQRRSVCARALFGANRDNEQICMILGLIESSPKKDDDPMLQVVLQGFLALTGCQAYPGLGHQLGHSWERWLVHKNSSGMSKN